MSKILRIDFYKASGPCEFDVALKKIWKLPNDDAKNFPVKDGPIRIRALEESGDFIYGDMMRIRLDEPGIVAGIHGGTRPIAVAEDEGLGETNAFMYHPSTGHLAYQRNRSGVSATRTAYYAQQKNDLEKAFEFVPILARVAVEQLIGKAKPKRVHLRVVAGALEQEGIQSRSLEELIDAAHRMDSPEIEITFSMGRRRKGGMKKDAVLQLVRNVISLRERGHEVKSLEVSAPDDEGGRAELLDFLDATLKSDIPVEPSQVIEEFYRRRIDCLKLAWQEHRQQLR